MRAVFLEDNWQLTPDLSVLLSGRYDHSDAYGGKFSPKVYSVYNLSPTLALKGGLTTGYKTPSLRSAATDFGSTSMGGAIIGNPNLRPETTRNVEVGLNYGNASTGVSGSLTVYKSEFKDKLLRTARICAQNVACTWGGVNYPAIATGYTTMENVDSAELQGLEWTMDWKINRDLTYRHSYTFAESEQTSGTNIGRPLNDIPKHMFNVSLDWRAAPKLTLWTQLNVRGETSGRATNASGSATNDLTYPSYTFMDVGVVYDLTKDMKLRLGVYNIANKVVTAEEGYAYILDGRRYSVAMNYRF
jgi:outer membrane receptor for ferrienterochelin and colicins